MRLHRAASRPAFSSNLSQPRRKTTSRVSAGEHARGQDLSIPGSVLGVLKLIPDDYKLDEEQIPEGWGRGGCPATGENHCMKNGRVFISRRRIALNTARYTCATWNSRRRRKGGFGADVFSVWLPVKA
jgi:hypothetical protein